jgi:hypothetical protein
MFDRRTMTYLAGDVSVIGPVLYLRDIVMAFLADQRPGVIDIQRHDLIYGVRPVMPVFAEGFGNQDYSGHYKTGKQYGEQDRQAYDLLRDFFHFQIIFSTIYISFSIAYPV